MVGNSLHAASGAEGSLGWWDTPTTHGLCPPGLSPSWLWHPGFPGHQAGKDTGFGPSVTGLCRGIRGQDIFSTRQPGSFCSVWPLWWPSMGKMLLRPPYWGLLKRNQDPPPLQRRRPSSWVKEMGHWECQTLPPDTQKSPGLQNLLTRQLLLSPPLCLTVVLPGKERSHGKGLTLTPITLISGSELIWRSIGGSQSGGRNFTLLSALWMGIVMKSKSTVWLISKLQPSACQLLRRKYMVPGLSHPAWQCYEGNYTLPQ